jgi:hypothetical protein
VPDPRHREYDDRWLRDAVSRLRLGDAVASLERQHDVACAAIGRADVEAALGHAIDDARWREVRTALRASAGAQVREALAGLAAELAESA